MSTANLIDDAPPKSGVVYPPEHWSPRPDQMDLQTALEANIRNVLAITHRRWGKDEIFMTDCACHAIEEPGNWWYMLPEAAHVRRAIWESINPKTKTRRIDELFPLGIRSGKIRENEMAIPIASADGKESLVQFLGSDNYNKNVGGSPKGVYISEFALCDPKAIAYIRPILGENEGYLRLFSTMRGKNHAYTMLKENQDKPNWATFLKCNNYIPEGLMKEGIRGSITNLFSPHKIKEYLEENIQLYGPEVGTALTEQEYQCSAEEIVPGSFYLDLILKAEREGRLGGMAHRPDLPVYGAFDLGFTDALSIWYVQITESEWIHVIDYDEIHRTSIPEIIVEMKKKPFFYAGILLPHDGAHSEVTSGTTTEKLFESANMPVQVMPQTDDATQIPSVRTLIPRCRFANTPTVKRGLECLRHFHNKKKDEGGKISWSPKPVHDWSSHAAKAFATLAYFAPELRAGVQPPKQPTKDLFANYQHSYEVGGWMR